jgi:hypothetical protein
MHVHVCICICTHCIPGTIKALDSIRANRNKFICLNDNLGDNDAVPPPSNYQLIIRAFPDNLIQFMHDFLANFYSGMLPLPSPFELPAGQSNEYLR